VTVMAQDPKGGSASPLAGAHITANGQSATTDRSGHAVITGSFENGIEVKATANDFNSQVRQVSITQPQRTGVANFLLQSKDALSLIIEVRTGSNQLLPECSSTRTRYTRPRKQ